ncbi:MAG: hypothetical protein QOG89_1714 [Thermomicrobiales bacterium]|nr:hypothetical protein [Thermomicrobiales bacterium]
MGSLRPQPRPVFVLGSLRSGASLLTLSLGQHPNLLQVLETNWFERFGIGLQEAFAEGFRHRSRSQLDVAGIEVEDFFAHFGEGIDRLMLRSVATGGEETSDGVATSSYCPQRWVDGTPSNCFGVFVLSRLFPSARFVHIVRDVEEVVTSLTTEETRRVYKSRYLRLTEEQAYRHWLDTTRACLEAERAFGSAVVLRVRRDDLIAAPEQTLRRCLDFLGEPFAPACLRPFSSVHPAEQPLADRAGAKRNQSTLRKLQIEAETLNDFLFAEASRAVAYSEDPLRIAEMEAAFSARCERGLSGVPTTLPGFGPSKRGRLGGLPSWLSAGLRRGMIGREPGSR